MAVRFFPSLWVALCIALLATNVAGAPFSFSATNSSSCKNPSIRREWRTLSAAKRLEFIEAIKCMMAKPAQTSTKVVPGVRSHYDDYIATHIASTMKVHWGGSFYPYHRLLLNTFQKSVEECGYTDGIPYWDWTLDAPGHDANPNTFFNSPLFDDETGFGGNGEYVPGTFDAPDADVKVAAPQQIADHTGGGCLTSGPFAGLFSNLGPHDSITFNPHCIRRDFSPLTFRDVGDSSAVAISMKKPDYGYFERDTELQIHAAGHFGVGGLYGTMSDMWSSPGDPLFWLHHANLDRTWWSWQTRDLSKREFDISGPLVAWDYNNTKGGNVTMGHRFHVGETIRTEAAISELMHIQKGPFCYDFDELY